MTLLKIIPGAIAKYLAFEEARNDHDEKHYRFEIRLTGLRITHLPTNERLFIRWL